MSSEQAVHDAMIAKRKTLSLAESCTGGRMASRLTLLPGASKYFLGSLVVYSNELKLKLLNVSPATLQKQGAISAEVVEEMVRGLLKVTGSDYGIAVTGIAGPDGGTLEKPVGTVWCAVMSQGQEPVVWKHQVTGNRESIIDSSVDAALSKLHTLLTKSS
jgi:PncC family amidohydrolase